MLKLKVDGKFDFVINKVEGKLQINGNNVQADVIQSGALTYHILDEFKSYNLEVISFDHAEKIAEIKVNGHVYNVSAKDRFDVLLDQLGLSSITSAKAINLKAPMPGLVLKVFVYEGAEVKRGDNLFVLEAMKMENIIKAPADGVIKEIKLKTGDKIEKGQILITFN